MSSEIFLAEVNLRSSTNQHLVFFNRTQANICVVELSESYDEVLVINNQEHLVLIVVGRSPDFILNLLSDVADVDAEVSVFSSQQAISVLMSIAMGHRWYEVPIPEIRKMITAATRQSMESDCFGEILRGIVEAALFANAKRCKREEHRLYHTILHSPSFERLDFSKMSIN